MAQAAITALMPERVTDAAIALASGTPAKA